MEEEKKEGRKSLAPEEFVMGLLNKTKEKSKKLFDNDIVEIVQSTLTGVYEQLHGVVRDVSERVTALQDRSKTERMALNSILELLEEKQIVNQEEFTEKFGKLYEEGLKEDRIGKAKQALKEDKAT